MSPPLPSRYLAQKLSEALPTTDGGVLRTIGDAINYMTALPKHRERRQAHFEIERLGQRRIRYF
jgi:hypothetical protein